MDLRSLIGQTAANALGTLIALGVVYLVGAIAGVFTFETIAVLASAIGVAAGVSSAAYSIRTAQGDADEEIRKAKEILRSAERRHEDD